MCIGALLLLIAVILAIEMQSLLIGESAVPSARVIYLEPDLYRTGGAPAPS